MKKSSIILSLVLTITMQAQDRPQPKKTRTSTSYNIKKNHAFVLPNGLKVAVENHKYQEF
jgi:hypothetical protein